jgi:hypothetical protein
MPAVATGRPARCADIRRRLREPLLATAPERATSWLLVEHPGPWPSLDLPSDLPPATAAVLERATAIGIRPQLIRRVADRRVDAATVLLASCRPGQAWLERRTLRDLRELADLDLTALADGRPPGFGTRAADPVVLVCTHGRRDVCCARLGRPVAVLLDRQLPGQVWETTHVGGDRFAPNVVTLPHGTYHGAVDVDDVPVLAEALTSGRVLHRLLRGRAGLPFPVQAADIFLRERLDLDAADAIRPGPCSTADGEIGVELFAGAQRWCVRVRASRCAEARLTSCAGDGTVDRPVSFELLSATRLA